MKNKNILAWTCILTALLCACGENADIPEVTDSSSETVTVSLSETSAPAETQPLCELPEYDWEGAEFHVLGMGAFGGYPQFMNFEIFSEGENGDIVNDAVYRRNVAIEDQYNVKITQTLNETPDIALRKTVNAGDSVYDLAFNTIEKVGNLAVLGVLSDMNQLDYVDYSKPWWNKHVNDACQIGDKLYYTTSDFALRDKSRTYILVYNHDITAQYDLADIYPLVKDGSWTIDVMQKYTKTFANDVDGNGKIGPADNFGIGLMNYEDYATFIVGMENKIIDKDNNGELKIVMNNEHMVNSIEKTSSLLSSPTAFYCPEFSGMVEDMWGASTTMFAEGKSLFMTNMPSGLSNLSKMCEYDYRIIPFPKYDEKQERYLTLPETGFSLVFSVPTDAKNPSFSGFMLEALSHASTTTSLQAYYEISCKVKHVYDEQSAEMLDLVFDGIVYDYGFFYDLGGLRNIIRSDVPTKGPEEFSSLYASKESRAEEKLSELIEEYAAIE